MLRVLHFGATGRLGKPTFDALVAAGHDVTAFVRSERRVHEARLAVAEDRVIVGDALARVHT